MSDAEIHHFCKTSGYNVRMLVDNQVAANDSQEIRKFALKPQAFLEGGKVVALRRHIERCQAEGKRMLLFSQARRRIP